MLSAPYNPDRLIVGTYSNAGQYSNPGGNSDLVLLGTTGCESVGDQFAIDQVAYNAAGNLQSVTLRGQFHCGDGIVHIAARWTAP